MKIALRTSLSLRLSMAALCLAGIAHADTIAWTTWTNGTSGASGSATGSIAVGSGISVVYSGQTSGILVNYPSWKPVSSFTGGTIGNGPAASNNSIQMEGGTSLVETVTFSSALINPVLAIESLGGFNTAEFDFTSAEPFSIQTGGPSAEYGGTGLTKSGNKVLGTEGSGVIQFTGTYTQLQFTTPVYENFYMMTVGDDISAGTAVTPEPETLSLLGIALAALPLIRRKFRCA